MLWNYTHAKKGGMEERFVILHDMITVGIIERMLFEQKFKEGKEQYKDLLRHRKVSARF